MELALCEDIHELGIFVSRDIRWEMEREHLSIVARDHDEIVASSSLLRYPNGWKVEHTLVAKGHRGQGLFGAIVGELIYLVRPDPVWAITRATGAFEGAGFHVVGEMARSYHPRIPPMERPLPDDELTQWRQERTRLALVAGRVVRVNRLHWRHDGTMNAPPWFFTASGGCPVVSTEDRPLELNALHQMW
jgi:hypothetical protein